MGILLNPDNIAFQDALNSKIYVDKTELIEYTNSVIRTEQKYICVSRPRRFGKSMAANMLTAYYSRGCDSQELFRNLKISQNDSFNKHINSYNTIYINMQNYFSESNDISEMIRFIEEDIIEECEVEFNNVQFSKRRTLTRILGFIMAHTKVPFVFIIDEWDCIFRVHKKDFESQKLYLDFLRNLLKDRSYVSLAYMTGILPIKKYGEHSAINVFYEYSMTDAKPISEFTGFTEDEVKSLCIKYNKDFDEMKRWYDGYILNDISIYNPKSVVESIVRDNYNNYWTSTETYEALKIYIELNFDGLREAVTELLSGKSLKIDVSTFTNDMVTFKTRDDVLTLLVHLGYLTYNETKKNVSIPNFEVSEQFASTINILNWSEVIKALKVSDELLNATIIGDVEKVAKIIEQTHQQNTSILKYNDENSLACVITLAYYSAKSKYAIKRELPAGKGFADIVFVPRRNVEAPAMVVELKYNKTAKTALDQIKHKDYCESLEEYSGEIVLVGINYDEEKNHSCVIERILK